MAKGVRGGNRWAYQHHLRILRKKAEDFAAFSDLAEEFEANTRALLDLNPDDAGFDADAVETSVRGCVDKFTATILATYRDRIFSLIETVIDANEQRDYHRNFQRISELREEVTAAVAAGGFLEQRYYLYLLDNLLEEMGYLTLSHVASEFEENGVRFEACLDIIRLTVANLANDGI